jgi:hypothetical protein
MLFSDLLSERPYPDELLNLYNPAYVGLVVYLGGRAFQLKAKRSLPICFPYLIFPLVAIESYRERLPDRLGKFYEWGRQNGDVLYDFPERAVALRPFVSSGLAFIRRYHLLEFDRSEQGFRFKANKNLVEKVDSIFLSSAKVSRELECASVAGRLLASDADFSAVLALFGLKP